VPSPANRIREIRHDSNSHSAQIAANPDSGSACGPRRPAIQRGEAPLRRRRDAAAELRQNDRWRGRSQIGAEANDAVQGRDHELVADPLQRRMNVRVLQRPLIDEREVARQTDDLDVTTGAAEGDEVMAADPCCEQRIPTGRERPRRASAAPA
jgi:hypothetical protein